ncbi:HutD family protein [Paeniglutamicibacter sp. MACA_103]|uniref:HutD family protein n=1 Tax=Paeniglutamicibacter sp. MACA_103 TaxID=3377337 RepID=UPI0038961C0F
MTTTNRSLASGTILHLADSTKRKWAQGEVREIAAGKLGTEAALLPAEGNEWDWRLSVASIEASGEFTPYDGFDRTLTVIAGELLELTIDGSAHAVEALRPLRFSGGSAVSAALPTGDVLALNLITRAGAVRGNVRIVELSKKREQHLFGAQFGVMLQGKAVVLRGESEEALELRDTVIGGEEDSPRISGRGFMAVVSLDLP